RGKIPPRRRPPQRLAPLRRPAHPPLDRVVPKETLGPGLKLFHSSNSCHSWTNLSCAILFPIYVSPAGLWVRHLAIACPPSCLPLCPLSLCGSFPRTGESTAPKLA